MFYVFPLLPSRSYIIPTFCFCHKTGKMDCLLFSAVFGLLLVFLMKLQFDGNTALLLELLTRSRRRRAVENPSNAVLLGRCITPLPFPPTKTRAHWMLVRSKDWWERVVLIEFTDQEWRENFRMTRQSFMTLCGLVEDFMAPEEFTVRAPIPLAMRVAIVLYRLGSSGESRLVANQFAIHKCTVKKFVYMFCKGMVKGPMKDLIRIPNELEASEIARRFETAHGVPQIMGIIDGSHIPVLPPTDGYKDFVNRKGWASYVLQAVVDDERW